MNKTPSDLLLYKLIPFINGNMRETKEDRINKWMLDYIKWIDEDGMDLINQYKTLVTDTVLKNDRLFWFAIVGTKQMIPYDIWRELKDCSNFTAINGYQLIYSTRKTIEGGKGQLTIEESYQHSNKRKREK